MKDKLIRFIQRTCDVIEILVAIMVGLGLVWSLIYYLPHGYDLLLETRDTLNFLLFLEDMFNLVVGIEFIKMLCKPNADNVIEVLIFLIARHMIIGGGDALDIFLSALSVALLFGVQQALKTNRFRIRKPSPRVPSDD